MTYLREHLEVESKQVPKLGGKDYFLTMSIPPAPNSGNDFSLPMIILTKTDILIKYGKLEMKNNMI